jgi:hypothetical protein
MFALPLSGFEYFSSNNTNVVAKLATYTNFLTSKITLPDAGNYITFAGSQFGVGSKYLSGIKFITPSFNSQIFAEEISTYDGTDTGGNPVSIGHVVGEYLSSNATLNLQWYVSYAFFNTNADRNSIVTIRAGSEIDTLTVQKQKEQRFSGALVLYGDVDDDLSDPYRLTLRSSVNGSGSTYVSGSGTQFTMDSSGSTFLNSLNVQDNDAGSGTLIECWSNQCTFDRTINWDKPLGAGGVSLTKIFEDLFMNTTGKEQLLINHTPTGPGTSWTLIPTYKNIYYRIQATVFTIIKGGESSYFSDGMMYTANVTYPTSNYVVEVWTGTLGSDYLFYPLHLCVRIIDINNMYCVDVARSKGRLMKFVGGVLTPLGSVISYNYINNRNIYIKIDGSTLSWGIGRPSVSGDSTQLDSVTDTSISATGKAGIGCGKIIAADNKGCRSDHQDNFRIFSLSETPTPPTAPASPDNFSPIILGW